MQAFTLFRQPTSNAVPLDVQPRLESWEGRDHPSQTALQTYLDHVEDTVGRELVAVRGDAAVSLDVGLPHDRPLTGGGGDLDNFLYPVVRRLGPRPVRCSVGDQEARPLLDLRPVGRPGVARPPGRLAVRGRPDDQGQRVTRMEAGGRRTAAGRGTVFRGRRVAALLPSRPTAQLGHAVETGYRCVGAHPRRGTAGEPVQSAG